MAAEPTQPLQRLATFGQSVCSRLVDLIERLVG